MKKFTFQLISFLLLIGISGSAQLTGEWVDENGTCYMVRQVGDEIYWSMDGRPAAVNVFAGLLVENIINGKWADVPGGDKIGEGTISLRVESNDRMVKIGQRGNYGANIWTRQACGATGVMVGSWKWTVDCGAAGVGSAEWKITSQRANGNFNGSMSDTSGPHIGSLEGTLNGNHIRMVRTVRPGHQQVWTGIFDPIRKTFKGTLTDPYHQDCSFTATKYK